MANVFSFLFKFLAVKVLAFRKALLHVYQLTSLTIQLVLSASNRGFLGPLSILMFWA
jgi:hypothetical protein